MLLDFYLALSDRGCLGSAQAAVHGAGTVPAHSFVRTQGLSSTSQISSSTAAAATAKYATKLPTLRLFDALVDFHKCLHAGQTLWIPKHPTRTALENQGQRKGTFSIYFSHCRSYQRDLSEGNIS